MDTSKRQKTQDDRYRELASLGRASFVSKSGIANLLAEVKASGLPDAFSRSSQYRARKHVCNTMTEYGKLVVEIDVAKADGTPMKMGFQNLIFPVLESDFYHHHNQSLEGCHPYQSR